MTETLVINDIPGDKSISHRSIIIGSLTNGISQFKGFLCSDDCLNTLNIFQQLGVSIEREGTSVTINSKGVNGFQAPSQTLNVGNSGTGIRLISGALAGSSISATLTGDHSIQKRPMGRIIDPLSQMGATINANNQLPPLIINGHSNLTNGFHYTMPIASAQVKSAILLSAVSANIAVDVTQPEECRDHTERMLELFGASITTSSNGLIRLSKSTLQAPKGVTQIPADISSALFFICYALMANQAMTFKNIGLNQSRIGCLEILKMMGAQLKIDHHTGSYEPMGDISIHPSKNRKNITVPLDLIPNIIDELPILAMLSLTQGGVFKVRGAEELRVKESDRIDGICRLVRALGANVNEFDDGFDISGPLSTPRSFEFDAHFDHRLAMSALIAASIFNVDGTIVGEESIQTSFPNFNIILNKVIKN
jgi:3-phosphoshikimate 1-carboxyvinyltransferase